MVGAQASDDQFEQAVPNIDIDNPPNAAWPDGPALVVTASRTAAPRDRLAWLHRLPSPVEPAQPRALASRVASRA